MEREPEPDLKELGHTVSDKITGFRGVALGKVFYLTGCNQVLVSPPIDKDGKKRESEWFDEQRLDIDETIKRISLNNYNNGFDAPAPKV